HCHHANRRLDSEYARHAAGRTRSSSLLQNDLIQRQIGNRLASLAVLELKVLQALRGWVRPRREGDATVLFFGTITPPRFRWIASRRGYGSCMRYSGAGSPNGPTACKVDAAVAARQAALDPITYRYVTTHNRRKRCRRPFDIRTLM